jgi:hypothetical protein
MLFKRPLVVFLLWSAALGAPLFSQAPAVSGDTGSNGEAGPSAPAEPGEEDPALTIDEAEIVYYIRNIGFDITGSTRPFALIYAGEFKEGERITGKKNLESYIEEKTRILQNQRTLEEVGIDFTAGESGEDGLVPVDLLVRVTDTWNFIALPWFEYDSNTGIEASVKARHYNFLGTMSPLRIDLGYKNEEEDAGGGGTFFVNTDSDIPFLALGHRWNLNFDNNFGYAYKEPFYYKNTTGLSVDLPYKSTVFTVGFEQAYILNEKNAEGDRPLFGTYFEDIWYMSSEIYGQWRIPTGLKVKSLGEVFYIPRLGGKINYRPGGEIGLLHIGPTLGFTQIAALGTVNWEGNFRRGLELSLVNIIEYNFHKYTWNGDYVLTYKTPSFELPFYYDKAEWNNILIFTAAGHLPVRERFGISGRLQYRQWFNAPAEAGDVLRGIKNSSVTANYMVSLNLDFPFLFRQFFVSEMLFSEKLRFFNFDMHVSPFVDMALADDPVNGRSFSFKDILISGGLEVLVFLHRMRSTYMRASVGVNLVYYFTTHSIPGGSNRELFIGFGHHY